MAPGSTAPPGRALDRLLNGLGMAPIKAWTAEDAVGHVRYDRSLFFLLADCWKRAICSSESPLFYMLGPPPKPLPRWLLNLVAQPSSGVLADSSVIVLKNLCRGASPLVPKETLGVEGVSGALLAFLRYH